MWWGGAGEGEREVAWGACGAWWCVWEDAWATCSRFSAIVTTQRSSPTHGFPPLSFPSRPLLSPPAQAHDEVRFLLYRLDFNDFARRRTRDEGLGSMGSMGLGGEGDSMDVDE